MGKWLFLNAHHNRKEHQHRQSQQFDREARMETVQSVTPPSHESVTHGVNAAEGIQTEYMENAFHVVTSARYVYAESVPESFVNEDVEDDIAPEDASWEIEDTDDAVPDSKKSASPKSSEFTISRSEPSAEIPNSTAGNGIQYNSSSPSGNQNDHYNNNTDEGITNTGSNIPKLPTGNEDSSTGAGVQISEIVVHDKGKSIDSHQGNNHYTGTGYTIKDAYFHGNICFGPNAQGSNTRAGIHFSKIVMDDKRISVDSYQGNSRDTGEGYMIKEAHFYGNILFL